MNILTTSTTIDTNKKSDISKNDLLRNDANNINTNSTNFNNNGSDKVNSDSIDTEKILIILSYIIIGNAVKVLIFFNDTVNLWFQIHSII